MKNKLNITSIAENLLKISKDILQLKKQISVEDTSKNSNQKELIILKRDFYSILSDLDVNHLLALEKYALNLNNEDKESLNYLIVKVKNFITLRVTQQDYFLISEAKNIIELQKSIDKDSELKNNKFLIDLLSQRKENLINHLLENNITELENIKKKLINLRIYSDFYNNIDKKESSLDFQSCEFLIGIIDVMITTNFDLNSELFILIADAETIVSYNKLLGCKNDKPINFLEKEKNEVREILYSFNSDSELLAYKKQLQALKIIYKDKKEVYDYVINEIDNIITHTNTL